MTKIVLWIYWIPMIFLVGCSQAVSDSQMVGEYVFSRDEERQELSINLDGKYVNKFYEKDVVVWQVQGNWNYDSNSGAVRGIALNKFNFGLLEYASGGTWFVVPEKTLLGTIELCFDPDLDYCLKK